MLANLGSCYWMLHSQDLLGDGLTQNLVKRYRIFDGFVVKFAH
jgi:hypothetical protein